MYNHVSYGTENYEMWLQQYLKIPNYSNKFITWTRKVYGLFLQYRHILCHDITIYFTL